MNAHHLEVINLKSPLVIHTPAGRSLATSPICLKCPIAFGEIVLRDNLVVLDMKDFDVILGMDWLATNHVTLDCQAKRADFTIQGKDTFSFLGRHTSVGVVSGRPTNLWRRVARHSLFLSLTQ